MIYDSFWSNTNFQCVRKGGNSDIQCSFIMNSINVNGDVKNLLEPAGAKGPKILHSYTAKPDPAAVCELLLMLGFAAYSLLIRSELSASCFQHPVTWDITDC